MHLVHVQPEAEWVPERKSFHIGWVGTDTDGETPFVATHYQDVLLPKGHYREVVDVMASRGMFLVGYEGTHDNGQRVESHDLVHPRDMPPVEERTREKWPLLDRLHLDFAKAWEAAS